MLTGFAHAAVCVPDVEEATRWYAEVLGLRVLSPPYEMSGSAIDEDLGELVGTPVVVKAAIVGLGADDHVLELIEYPRAEVADGPAGRPSITRVGLTHVGLVCDDAEATRRELEGRGVVFLTGGSPRSPGCGPPGSTIPGARSSSWSRRRHADRPYWRQYSA